MDELNNNTDDEQDHQNENDVVTSSMKQQGTSIADWKICQQLP
jgi:hypothetical protein